MRILALLLTLMVALPLRASADLVIRDVRVVHGDGRVTARATVYVRGQRIAAITAGASAKGAAAAGPAGVPQVDGAGRTLIPGLVDAHVHVTGWSLPLFIRYGVTTVRDLHNDPAYILPLAREDAPGRPAVIAAGALIDGAGSFWKNAIQVATVGEARAAVRKQVAAGASVIKVYTRLQPALVQTIVEEARARGVPVAAHVGKSTATQAAAAGITSLEHLSGVADAASADPARLLAAHDDFLRGWTLFEQEWLRLDPARLEQVAKALVARNVTIVPTLALHEAFSRLHDPALLRDPALAAVPREVVDREWDPGDIMGRAGWTDQTMRDFARALPVLQRFVATYARLGGRVAAGTDTPQQFVVPGASLHRELQLYVAGGLSPTAAIRAATIDAADLLGVADRVGTIDVGKQADLVLLDADPIADIRNTTAIRLVVKAGVVEWRRP